jgi:hypothetical protein
MAQVQHKNLSVRQSQLSHMVSGVNACSISGFKLVNVAPLRQPSYSIPIIDLTGLPKLSAPLHRAAERVGHACT